MLTYIFLLVWLIFPFFCIFSSVNAVTHGQFVLGSPFLHILCIFYSLQHWLKTGHVDWRLLTFVANFRSIVGIYNTVNTITSAQLDLGSPLLHTMCMYHDFQHLLKVDLVDLHPGAFLANFSFVFGIFGTVNATTRAKSNLGSSFLQIMWIYNSFHHLMHIRHADVHLHSRLVDFRSVFSVFGTVYAITHAQIDLGSLFL